jgi:glycosyltransferase involved in cell wall biosynthesis
VRISQGLTLDVVVPVYNEQHSLESSIRVLHATLAEQFTDPWRITIADNASTDDTPRIAARLAAELPGVVLLRLDEKGRGRALKRAWLESTADVVAYVDVDLSTDLRALPPLVAPLISGHSDIAIGTRLGRGSRVVRGAKREFVSRSYNLILRRAMGVTFTDAQCGFKAMRRDVAQRVLPLVEDTGWFFDTELLIIAERAGLRIHEVPVDWIDEENSSVDIVATATADLRGLVRVWRSILTGRIPLEEVYAELGRQPFAPPRPPSFFGQVIRFGIIGGISTLAYAGLYLALQFAVPEQLANFLALLITAVANTWANRRFTFRVRGRRGALTHQIQGLVVFGVAWAMTAGSLALLHAYLPDAGPHHELAILTAANLAATVMRFLALRLWVFRGRARHAPVTAPSRAVTSRDRVLSS